MAIYLYEGKELSKLVETTEEGATHFLRSVTIEQLREAMAKDSLESYERNHLTLVLSTDEFLSKPENVRGILYLKETRY